MNVFINAVSFYKPTFIDKVFFAFNVDFYKLLLFVLNFGLISTTRLIYSQ